MKRHDDPVGAMYVTVVESGQSVELRVRGELDMATAPTLLARLDEVLAAAPATVTVTLNLAELDFMDSSGLQGIVDRATRLDASGGSLTIRSPSPMVRRLLEITGLSDLIGTAAAGDAEPRRSQLAPEQSEAHPGSPVTSHTAAEEPTPPRRLAALPSDADVVDGALRLVVALARATVGGADGVSVSLRRHGRLSTVAATDQTILDMDADQYATGEGPCVEASAEGHWFHVESTETETRWPAFTPRARDLGINAILSSPLMAQDRPVGALNIYSRTTAAFTPRDQELASLFATEASAILTEAGVDVDDPEVAARFRGALDAREAIALAQGVIMHRDGVNRERAYTELRRASVESSVPLHQCAEQLLGLLQSTASSGSASHEAGDA